MIISPDLRGLNCYLLIVRDSIEPHYISQKGILLPIIDAVNPDKRNTTDHLQWNSFSVR